MRCQGSGHRHRSGRSFFSRHRVSRGRRYVGLLDGLAEGEAAGVGEGEAAGVGEGEAAGVGEGEAAGVGEGEAAGVGDGEADGDADGDGFGVTAGLVVGLALTVGEGDGAGSFLHPAASTTNPASNATSTETFIAILLSKCPDSRCVPGTAGFYLPAPAGARPKIKTSKKPGAGEEDAGTRGRGDGRRADAERRGAWRSGEVG